MPQLKNPPKVIVLIGLPGSGKGTLAAALAAQTGFFAISTGDALRLEVANKSSIGLQAKVYLDAAKLVPDELIWPTVKKVLIRHPNGVILDGYPRLLQQAEQLDRYVGSTNVFALRVVADEPVRLARLGNRNRDDDTPAKRTKRDADFKKHTQPLIAHYKMAKRGSCIWNNTTPDALMRSAIEQLDGFIPLSVAA